MPRAWLGWSARNPVYFAQVLHVLRSLSYLGEERQNGDASMAANNGDIHVLDIEAGLLSIEGLGADL